MVKFMKTQYSTNGTAKELNKALLVHFESELFSMPGRRKVKAIVRIEETPGGYWRGSRVHTGLDPKTRRPLFKLSVPDCGGGSKQAHDYFDDNKVEPIKFERFNDWIEEFFKLTWHPKAILARDDIGNFLSEQFHAGASPEQTVELFRRTNFTNFEQ
jgi:hypothetical protein